MTFATVIVVDWSASSRPAPEGPMRNTPWVARVDAGAPARIVPPDGVRRLTNHRTRASVMQTVQRLVQHRVGPVLLGWDFGFGYPAGFAASLGLVGWEGTWTHLAAVIEDGPDNGNNRLDVAADLNDHFAGPGPFWGRTSTRTGLPPAQRLPARHVGIVHGTPQLPFLERRLTELALPRAQPMFKMAYAGSVGSQSMLGIARLAWLRVLLGDRGAVWPFQPLPLTAGRLRPDAVVLAEVYPSMFTPTQAHPAAGAAARVPDANQVLYTADAIMRLPPSAFDISWMPDRVVEEEGWVLGAPRP